MRNLEDELEPLLPAIEKALSTPGPVILCSLWSPISSVSLLPFHLHLRWLGKVSGLKLTATFGVLPGIDESLLSDHRYSPCEAVQHRRRARAVLASTGATQAGDLVPPDWEPGVDRHREDLEDVTFTAASFVSIDTVNASAGTTSRGTRPGLGQFAVRDAPRPRAIVPGRGSPETPAFEAFKEPDVVLIDAQRVRGRRSLQWITEVSARRNGATVIVVAGPSDLVALGRDLVEYSSVSIPHTVAGLAPSVDFTQLPSARDLDERRFDFATRVPEGVSQAVEYGVVLGKAAWWAMQQSVSKDVASEPEVRAYNAYAQALASSRPSEASELSSLSQLIQDTESAQKASESRVAGVVDAALRKSGSGEVLVLVRSWSGARSLVAEIANELGVTQDELSQLGVHVRSTRSRCDREFEFVIVAGYFGRDAIDAALQYRPRSVHFFLDPVEARAAWYGIDSLLGVLPEEGKISSCLRCIQEKLSVDAPGWTDGLSISTSLDAGGNGFGLTTPVVGARGDVPLALVALADGTVLAPSMSTRFQVLGRLGGRVTTKAARDLEQGDEIVILEEDAQAKFSDILMRTLDEGVLKPFVKHREAWLTLVGATMNRHGWTTSQVATAMSKAGIEVESHSVRSWTSFRNPEEASVPRKFAVFLALAKALDLPLPEEVLGAMFTSIRRLRTLHRKAGRDLTRAIRHARTGRLDAAAQLRLERDWGLSAARLVQAARVGLVDEVIIA